MAGGGVDHESTEGGSHVTVRLHATMCLWMYVRFFSFLIRPTIFQFINVN